MSFAVHALCVVCEFAASGTKIGSWLPTLLLLHRCCRKERYSTVKGTFMPCPLKHNCLSLRYGKQFSRSSQVMKMPLPPFPSSLLLLIATRLVLPCPQKLHLDFFPCLFSLLALSSLTELPCKGGSITGIIFPLLSDL